MLWRVLRKINSIQVAFAPSLSLACKKVLKRLLGLVSIVSLPFILSSCSALIEKSSDSEGTKSEQVSQTKQSETSKVKKASRPEEKELLLSSQEMFQIMAAEMMLKRKQPQLAFTALYPVTERVRDPELAKRLFHIAMATYHLQSIEAATHLWRDIAPESATAWRASFILSLRKGLVDQAMIEWDTFQKLSKSGLQSDLVLTATKVSSAVPEKYGIEFFERLIKEYPIEWTAHYGLGAVGAVYQNADVGIGALERARDLLEQKNDDSYALIHSLLSKLYLNVKPAQKGIDALTPYLENNPSDLLVQERVARLEVQAKLYDAAEKRYQYIVDQEPEAYTSIFSLGLLQLERRDYEKAAKNLHKVANRKGYQTAAYYYLGILYQETEDYAKAREYLNRVLDTNYALDATLHLAEILFIEDDRAEADRLLNALKVEKISDQIKIIRAKSILANSAGEVEEAIKYYDEALVLEPNNSAVLKAQSVLFYNSKRYSEYEDILLKLVKMDPNDSDSLNALGYFYVESQKNLDEAFELLTRALEIAPDSFFILDSMGWYYYQVGQYGRALKYLERAFDKVKDKEVFVHMIAAYWANGEQEEAQRLWEEYRSDFNENRQVQNIINDLERGLVK